MRVLVICDDYWHPGRVPHEGLASLGAHGIDFEFVDSAKDWSAERMTSYPLVLVAKSNDVSHTIREPWVTLEVEAAFSDYVKSGRGILFIHSGTIYKDLAGLRSVIGGAFISHPPQCAVTIEPRSHHPLCAGVETFTITDEHYQMELDDPTADVFLSTTSEHGSQPGGWTRRYGEGRVAVLTPGHNLEVWRHQSFQTLVLNALRWCSGEPSDQ